jgi:integration host factor subunit beta
MPTVNTPGLVDAVADVTQLTKGEIKTIVTTLFEAMATALGQGDKIELRGFGSFHVRQRPAGAARNPKTGAGVLTPARRVLHFRPAKLVRQRLAAEDGSIGPTVETG